MDRSFIELLKRISTIPSPTFHEKEKGELIAGLLARAGLRVSRDGLYNVLAWSGEEIPQSVILIEAHMDTVFDESVPLKWIEEDETIRCPSVADNSVALAALVVLAQKHSNWPNVVFAATTREEGPGKGEGMKRLIEGILGSGREIKYSISLEGIPQGRITYTGIGSIRAKVSIETTGGHPWLEPSAPSAVHTAAAIVSKIVDSSGHRESPKTTVNVGTICGGTLPTVRASESYFTLDIRSVDRESLHKTFDLCKRLAGDICAQAKAGMNWEIISSRDPVSLREDHELIGYAREVHRRLGIESRIRPAATNASLPLSMGLAAVTLGVCEGGKTHSREEWISKNGIERGILQLEYLLDLLQRGDGS